MEQQFIDLLTDRLNQSLPGPEAQYKMAHAVRPDYEPAPSDSKRAGVLALFYPHDGNWRIVLIERQSHNPDDRHRGQISFPGGRYEKKDGRISNTALREAEEEIGVTSSSVRLLGPLSELYIPVSNFLVSPFVGYVPSRPEFRPQEDEVKSILEVPFQLFQNDRNVKTVDMAISSHITLKNVPYFDIMGKIVWGATAMMISELLELLRR